MTPRVASPDQIEAREIEIIQAAAQLVEKEGVNGLTIDKVVAVVPYSKGTVYNHFSSKEDLLIALCIYKLNTLSGMFARAKAFNGSTRERLVAFHMAYFLYALLSPGQAMAVLYTKTPEIECKASECRMARLTSIDGELLSMVVEVMAEAQANQEVHLPPHLNLQQVAFGNWSIAFGTIALLNSHLDPCPVSQGLLIDREYFNNVNALLDGYGFQPLSPVFDFQHCIERLLKEVFAEEVALLAQRGRTLMI
ncbi:transcriptional regulator, TetR family [Oceanospirillum multiglobuliferum]|uniref:HTH tetR-type domain-containing protein n=1 Tax=Oceanospirillum multiglobuliferum TaxID=64969 RepID=A0A1T4N8F1_9GAMM|nr:TetR/AcrR family transcriptional regulator [Oceanospirillum multiglobuliferum]OPX55871.1 hypothetical protein BTE48_06670 [Oceanospirillum multiglobuliferum]SJZ75386.1 transcriptional regulator, TetR family [Oceanospirillum multiglobuliferum]